MWRSLEFVPDFGAVWDGANAASVVATYQLAAAERADEYVGDQIDRSGPPRRPVRPTAVAGVASDGRPLATLLRLPAASTIKALNVGVSRRDAFAVGRRRLLALGSTQVLDAGRAAVSVAQTAAPEVIGYRRHLRGSTNCARCIVLAGRLYRWSTGFARRPQCDCEHRPVTERDDEPERSPEQVFRDMDRAQQDAVFGEDGAQAIRDGADLGQVVNARRGMKDTTAYGRKVTATTFGTGQQPIRLVPEQIYKDAKDRVDAIRLLQVHGYI